jgi:hypothetical protein
MSSSILSADVMGPGRPVVQHLANADTSFTAFTQVTTQITLLHNFQRIHLQHIRGCYAGSKAPPKCHRSLGQSQELPGTRISHETRVVCL